jgi:hypothetical protein
MNGEISPRVRSKIVKVPDTSPGLLFVNGQQMPFVLEGVWKSPVAPAANMTVDVDLDGAGSIAAITVVDSKEAAGQKMQEVLGVAKEQLIRLGKLLLPALRSLSARMGAVALGAAVLLWIAWFFFPAAGVDIGGGRLSFTFWGLLGVDFNNPESMMNGGSNHGLFSFLGLLAIAVPFAVPYLRMAWSKYLTATPLAYFVIAFIAIFVNERRAVGDLMKMGAPNPFSWSVMIIVPLVATVVLGLGALKKGEVSDQG